MLVKIPIMLLTLLCRTMVLKLCVATPWCVVLIFQGRRTNVNSVQFYSMN